jgi:hypothetical protein
MTQATKRGAFRRVVAKTAVLGLVVGGAIAMTAISAGADSPNPGTNNGGTGQVNVDGTITVTVHGSWVWNKKDCPDNGKVAGWAVSWGDNTANPLADDATVPPSGVYVGDESDNLVHTDATFTCTDNGDTVGGDFAETLTHTYASGTDPASISACIVTYDVDGKSETGKHSTIAGGTDRNSDNSVEENGNVSEACPIIPIEVSPLVVTPEAPPAPPAPPVVVQPAFTG